MGVRRVGALVLLVALLVACAEQAPTSLPPVTAAPVASAVVPVAAEAETSQGAAAFVRFWYAEITRAWALRDASIVERLCAPSSETCERYIASMQGTRARGERLDPVTFELTLVEAQALTGKTARVSVIYDHPVTRRFDSAGRQLSVSKARRGVQETREVVRSGRSWLVTR
jgi:hypothetical protein